jgi:hypothetical protein
MAESGAYRVEVIVFRNLEVMTEAVREEELRSFSHYPDLQQMESDDISIEMSDAHLPDALNIITQKSARMDGTWRRLRSSQGYRPLLYTAWDQSRTDYYPPMRVHNTRMLDEQLRPPTNIVIANLAAEDPLAAYRSEFYQLDGSVQLRRSRFLHLFLDLEYRDQQLAQDVTSGTTDAPNDDTEFARELNSSGQYDIFRLKENRQIRTGRLQYFDTPYFGALVLVTAIESGQ